MEVLQIRLMSDLKNVSVQKGFKIDLSSYLDGLQIYTDKIWTIVMIYMTLYRVLNKKFYED